MSRSVSYYFDIFFSSLLNHHDLHNRNTKGNSNTGCRRACSGHEAPYKGRVRNPRYAHGGGSCSASPTQVVEGLVVRSLLRRLGENIKKMWGL